MRLLQLPAGHLSLVVAETQYNADRHGVIEVDDNHVQAAVDHGATHFDPKATVAGNEDNAARAAIDRLGSHVQSGLGAAHKRIGETEEKLEAIGRNAMFAVLKAAGVVVSRTLSNEKLTEIYEAEMLKAETADAEKAAAEKAALEQSGGTQTGTTEVKKEGADSTGA